MSFVWKRQDKHGPDLLPQGEIEVCADGSLSLVPADDYYWGTIPADEAVRLARLILALAGEK